MAQSTPAPSISTASRGLERYWPWAALLVVLLALGRLWWLPAHASLSVNEGWNTGQAIRALGAGALYPDPEALIANNYPPLSFIVLGALGELIGDTIIAGRIVALLAQLATGLAIWAIVGRLAPGRRWQGAAALLFGLYSVTLLRNYVAINDPQWLGHAAMTWGMFFLVPRCGGQTPAGASIATSSIIIAALLTMAGVLIKHNLVAFPVAVTLWLWLADRRALARWVAIGGALAALSGIVLWAIWGATVFIDVLAPARSYSVLRLLAKGGPLILAMLPVIIACRPLLAGARVDRRLALPLILLAVSIPIGIVQRAGSGVDVNAFFEAVIALAIAVPVATALRPDRSYAWIAISVLPALCLVPTAASASLREFRDRDTAVRNTAPQIAAIAGTAGPVACDDQAICYWAGRESAIDFFSVKQRLLHGRAKALAPALAEGRFAMIQMRSDNPGWQENRLIPAIRAHYADIYRKDGIELLVPRSGSARPAR